MQDSQFDVRFEIKVAMFWRKLIGDSAYQEFDPEDLFRWYMALDLAGPADVRELFHRRQGSRPMAVVRGLVDVAPHPPAAIVQAWLEKHETAIRTGPWWGGLAVFTSLSFLFGVYMNGCQDLHQNNPTLLHPPPIAAAVLSAPAPMPASTAVALPVNPTPPVFQLPSLPQVASQNIISPIPILATIPAGTLRTSPLQSGAQTTHTSGGSSPP